MTDPAAAGSIVVGVDGSPGSDQALEWAARQASLEHRPLTIVHASNLDHLDRHTIGPTVVEHAGCDVAVVPCGVTPV